MTPRNSSSARTIYQLKVTLNESDPPIWRRVQVPGDISLKKLHKILQAVMGWSDSHLHEFEIDGAHYSEPDPDFGRETKSENTKLHQVVRAPRAKFLYLYDFGDGWEHEVVVEKILPAKAGVIRPVCLAGARACPPEDCGGIGGYADFLEAIRDRKHPEHDTMLEWIGGSFDPEAFDLQEVNQEVRRIR